MTDPHDDWWASLNHGGLLIAPAKIPAYFADAPEALSHARADRLRRDVVRMLDEDSYMSSFLDQMFESLLELPQEEWLKASDVGPEWSHAAVTGEAVRPRRVWKGPRGEVLPLFATDGKWGRGAPRIGVGKGRRAVSRVIEWLRNADREVAVLTNGRQIRLLHAGTDHDAFCEWDIELWFAEGAPGPQVTALRRLLSRTTLVAADAEARSPLLQAIHESRRGQGELSAVLGERVRQAVELLIHSSSPQLEQVVADGNVTPNQAYIAATRIVMRLVVVLFAEARELLPRVDPVYHGSYGLQGLREELDREAGGKSERLRHRHSAWPRLLALFRLVYGGSAHAELQVPEYGGGLFQPGVVDSEDPISRALAAFESPKNGLPDDVVHRMLERLTRSRVKLRQGRRSTYVEAPVDFSDLSSEYIGILYEGLLDYELRRAPVDDPMVFLEIGDQPALPLSRLDAMTAKERGELLEKLKKESKKSPAEGDNSEEDELEEEAADEEDSDSGDETSENDVDDEPPEETSGDDLSRQHREMVDIWARNAVRDAGWTKRGADLFDDEVTKAARNLIRRVVLPGEWFLVRWGGTRKGAGTFYTRPQLASPTTRRTLQPLAYRAVKEIEKPETGLVEVEQWEPRTPEEILKLRVCDPAMGSGSFLVSALRYLSDALFESLHHHQRLEPKGEGTIARLADGVPAEHPSCETLPVPADHESFEDRLTARLKRHVVERCIYGVDIDPVAVELARLALWIETMDRTLPFEFLDHKLKAGNSLVGCWFDRFQDYPIRAWDREGGDHKHERFIHHFREVVISRGKKKGQTERRGDPWTQAIKDRRTAVRAELAGLLASQSQPSFRYGDEGKVAEMVHSEAREALEKLHAIPIHDSLQRARFYADHLTNNTALQSLRRSFNLWCALWFWPGDRLDIAPGPRSIRDPREDALRVAEQLAEQHRFFHWELEFPDVFDRANAGFDAILGNPPWDVQKPSSKEFFSNHDPLYRSYGKQDALRAQTELFEAAAAIEHDWIAYQARFRAMSNWVKYAGEPFGDPTQASDDKCVSLARGHENERLHALWRKSRGARTGFTDPAHPFRHQGSADVNTYKLFLESAYRCVRHSGRLSLIVPASFYGDKGSSELRRLFLDDANLSHLYAFQNERRLFLGVDHTFKMCIPFLAKEPRSKHMRALFRLGIAGSPSPEDAERQIRDFSGALDVTKQQLSALSPASRSVLEIEAQTDLAVDELLVRNSVPLGDEGSAGWGIRYASEFHMTNDSKLFPPRPKWEADGYVADEYGYWLKGPWREYSGSSNILSRPEFTVLSRDGTRLLAVDDVKAVALPLYEGRSVGQYDFQRKGWVSGKGRRAVWREIPWQQKVMEPQFLIARSDLPTSVLRPWKVVFMDVARSNVERTAIATPLQALPCGNSAPVLVCNDGEFGDALAVAASMNSFAYDFFARQRCTGLHLNWFVVAETPLPRPERFEHFKNTVSLLVARLALPHPHFARGWLRLHSRTHETPLTRLFAITPHERLRIRCQLEAFVAYAYDLDIDDLDHILRDTDYPVEWLSRRDFSSTIESKRFWLMDRAFPPELRTAVLTRLAFRQLKEMGPKAFFETNDGEGWMLPETVKLADYGLGHDSRAHEYQPVARAMGPRFLDWQLATRATESWEEYTHHAALLDRLLPLPSLEKPGGGTTQMAEPDRTDVFGAPIETDLFGMPIAKRKKARGR